MIPEAFIQELLNRVDIVDVVDRSVPLKNGWARITLPVAHSTTKNPPLFYCQSDQAVLSLLRVRRAWHGDWVPDGIPGAELCGGGTGACQIGGSYRAAGIPRSRQTLAESRIRLADGVAAGIKLLPR